MRPAPSSPLPSAPALITLASSSSGNCSALLLGRDHARRLILIDAGFSPRRTRSLLALAGLADIPIAAIVFTHLDIDHCHPGCTSLLDHHTPLFIHRRHTGRAHRLGILSHRSEVFDHAFAPLNGLEFRSALCGHDDLGAAAFRISIDSATLGFATDLGTPTDDLLDLLAGVDVLAIESNYCPQLQRASDRPDFLKDRIMGGRGHLSNQQAAAAAAHIDPASHVLLLHLSRQCNRPDLAAAEHAGRPYSLTIASPTDPTPHIPITPTSRPPRPPRHQKHAVSAALSPQTRQLQLFRP